MLNIRSAFLLSLYWRAKVHILVTITTSKLGLPVPDENDNLTDNIYISTIIHGKIINTMETTK